MLALEILSELEPHNQLSDHGLMCITAVVPISVIPNVMSADYNLSVFYEKPGLVTSPSFPPTLQRQLFSAARDHLF